MTDQIKQQIEQWPSDPVKLEEFLIRKIDEIRMDARARAKPYNDALIALIRMKPPTPFEIKQCGACGTIYAPKLGGCYHCDQP